MRYILLISFVSMKLHSITKSDIGLLLSGLINLSESITLAFIVSNLSTFFTLSIFFISSNLSTLKFSDVSHISCKFWFS